MVKFFEAYAAFLETNPFMGFLLLCATYYALTAPFRFGFAAWNRYCRTKNIREKGWPPQHLDADGDFKKDET